MRYYAADKPWGDILPRYSFFEPLCAGKQVLEVGCGDGTGAMFLGEHNAATVVGLEVDGPALAAALNRTPKEGIRFAPLDPGHLELPTSSMDVVFAFDLSAWLESSLIAEIRRVLRPKGFLITAVANPQYRALARIDQKPSDPAVTTLEALIQLLGKHFLSVRVVGQTPFLGFSLGLLGDEGQEAPLEMDSVLLSGTAEQVAYHVVICGRESWPVDHQSLVQLPYRAVSEELHSHFSSRLGRTLSGPGGTIRAEVGNRHSPQVELERQLQEATRIAEERARSLRRVEEKLAEVSGRMTQMESRVVASDRHEEVLRQQLVQKDRLLEKLRTENQARQGERVNIEVESFRQLLGLSEGASFEEEDVPRLVRQALAEKQHALEEFERTRTQSQEHAQSLGRLQQEVDQARAELADIRREKDEIWQVARRREEEVAEKRSWLEALDSEAEKQKKRLTEIAEQAVRWQRQNEELGRELKACRSTTSDLELELKNSREKHEGLSLALQRHSQELVALQQERRNWESEKLELLVVGQERQERLDETLRKMELLQQDMGQDHDRAEHMAQTIASLEQELATARSGEGQQQARVMELQQALERSQRLASDQNEREQSWRAEQDTLQEEAADRQEELLQLQHRLTEEAGRNSELSRRWSEQIEHNRELELDLVSLFNRIENGEVREHDRQKLIKELEGRLVNQHQDLDDSREKIDQLTHELFQAKQREEDLSAAIELMRVALQEQSRTQEQLHSELAQLRPADGMDVNQLEQRTRQVEMELSQRDRQLSELKAKNQLGEHAIAQLRAEVMQRRQELNRVQDRLAEALDRLAEASGARIRLVDTERELAWNREEVSRLGAEMEVRSEELDTTERDLERTQEELVGVFEELARTQKQRDQAVEGAARVSKEPKPIEEEVSPQATPPIEELERALAEQKQRFEELLQAHVEVSSNMEKAKNQWEAAQTEQQEKWRLDLEQARDKAQAASHEAQQRLEAANLCLLELQQVMEQSQQKSQEISRQLEGRTQDYDDALKKWEEEKVRSRMLAEELDRLRLEGQKRKDVEVVTAVAASDSEMEAQARVKTLQGQLQELEKRMATEIASLGSDIHRRDERLQSLTMRLVESERRANAADSKNRELEQKVAELVCETPWQAAAPRPGPETDRISLERNLETTRVQLQQAQSDLVKLQGQAEEAKHMFQKILAERETQLKTLKMQLADRSERVNRLAVELSALKSGKA